MWKHIVCNLSYVIIICFYSSLPVIAQDSIAAKKPSLFKFSGTSALRWQFASRQGTGQQLPPNYIIWELSPTLSIAQIPIGFDMLLSSYEDASRQRVNSAQIKLNYSREQMLGILQKRLQQNIAGIGSLNDIQQVNATREWETRVLMLDKQIEKTSGDTTINKSETKKKKLQQLKDERNKLKNKIAKIDAIKDKLEASEQYRPLLNMQQADWKNPQKVQEILKSTSTLGKAERFFLAFRTLSLGNSVGNYSPLTLQGAQLNGANIEFNPGLFYVAFVYGSIQRPVYAGVPENSAFSRNFKLLKMGLGQPENTHLFFSIVKSADNISSLNYSDTVTNPATPLENLLVGTDVKLSLFRKKLQWEAEIMGSMSNNDLRTAKITSKDVPTWVLSLAEPRITSYYSYAYTTGIKANLFKDKTRVKANMRYIAPGYIAFGVPNLRNDVVRYEARIDQNLLKSNLTLGMFLRRDEDNLLRIMKRGSTVITAYGIEAGIRFSKNMQLNTSFAPYSQISTLRTGGEVQNDQVLFNSALSFNTSIAECNNSFALSYARRSFMSTLDSIDNINNLLTFSDNIQLSERVSTTISISNTITSSLYNDDSMFILGGDIDLLLGKTFSLSTGYEFTNQNATGIMQALFATTSFPIKKWLHFNVTGKYNNYTSQITDNLPADFDEFVMNCSLKARW